MARLRLAALARACIPVGVARATANRLANAANRSRRQLV